MKSVEGCVEGYEILSQPSTEQEINTVFLIYKYPYLCYIKLHITLLIKILPKQIAVVYPNLLSNQIV